MNSKLFFSTFLLIFLAELGDKTQLAAMARAATGDGGKWTVFFGASLALVVSTLLAVLFGSALARVVPESAIKTAAGVLFLVFGALILVDVYAPGRLAITRAKPGMAMRFVLKLAAEFEQAAAADYARLAAQATDPAVRALMETLAAEEADHLARVRQTQLAHEAVRLPEARAESFPAAATLTHDVAAGTEPVLRHAIEHEQATARFYEELARVTPLATLKSSFQALAEAEWGHVRRLEALRDASAGAQGHPAGQTS